MPPKSKKPKPCWCGGFSHQAEVECSNCERWIHYVCLGLTMKQLSDLINEDPGIYICKCCTELPNFSEVEQKLKDDNGNCETFCFSPVPGECIPNLLSNLSAKLDELSTQVSKSQTALRPQPSYSQIASRNVANIRATQQAVAKPSPTLQLCDSTKSIIISKIDNPRQFSSSLSLKNYIRTVKPEMLEKISQGKLLASGNIIGGNASFRRTNFPNMQEVDRTIHGPGAPDDATPNPRFVILKNLSKEYSIDDIKTEISLEYTSAGNFTEISTGPDRHSRHIKLSLNNDEFNQILTHRAHIGLCLYRAEPWKPKPMQCFNCQRFGHFSIVCRSTPRCINCGESHARTPGERCSKPTSCCNCKGGHMANSSKCDHYKLRLANNVVQ